MILYPIAYHEVNDKSFIELFRSINSIKCCSDEIIIKFIEFVRGLMNIENVLCIAITKDKTNFNETCFVFEYDLKPDGKTFKTCIINNEPCVVIMDELGCE